MSLNTATVTEVLVLPALIVVFAIFTPDFGDTKSTPGIAVPAETRYCTMESTEAGRSSVSATSPFTLPKSPSSIRKSPTESAGGVVTGGTVVVVVVVVGAAVVDVVVVEAVVVVVD